MPERQQEFSFGDRATTRRAKDLYDSLLKRYDEAQLVESMETDRQGERFRILEAGDRPPRARARPTGCGSSSSGCSSRRRRRSSSSCSPSSSTPRSTPSTICAQFTRVPVLATIPHIAAGRGRAGLADRAGHRVHPDRDRPVGGWRPPTSRAATSSWCGCWRGERDDDRQAPRQPHRTRLVRRRAVPGPAAQDRAPAPPPRPAQ